MPMSRRSVVAGSISLIAASEVGAPPAQSKEAPLPPTDSDMEPSFIFDKPVTAMCVVNVNTVAIACANEVYFVKVQ